MTLASAHGIALAVARSSYWQERFRNAQPQVLLPLQHLFCRNWQLGQDDELHVQLPFWQALLVHAWPHEPQLLMSVCSLTQVPPQFV
jgi:hypothetical protein